MRVVTMLGLLAILLGAIAPPVSAADATLAPADESFGRFNLSVLGIANSLRDGASRLDGGADARVVMNGPLAFATDAIHAWEVHYPNDPWIAKDLLALETVYLKIPTDDAFRLASHTEAWLLADFPTSSYVAKARSLIDVASQKTAPNEPSNAWERFAALRVPVPPR